jgi:hypothetical protein
MNSQTVIDEHPQLQSASVPEQAPPCEPAAEDPSVQEPKRCQHRFVNRTRCRLLVSLENPWFCPRHADLPQNYRPTDLTSELFGEPAKLGDLEDLYHFLTTLLYLASEDRISTKRAAVLAYITNQILRTDAAIRRQEDAAPPQVVFGAPRPIRD